MTDDNNENTASQAARVEIDESDVYETYANLFSVTGSPEEVTLDFGLFRPERKNTAKLKARVFLNYYNAKRLITGLTQTVRRYEQTYGTIETDVRKRMRKRS